MKKRMPILAALAAATALLAACGGGSNGSSPTPSVPCNIPQGFALVYPAQGSAGNADNLSQIIVATQTTTYPSYYLDLSVGGNPAIATGQFATPVATPLPQPTTAPTYANPVFQSVTISQPLANSPTNGAKVELFVNDSANQNCGPADTGMSFSIQ